MNSEQKPKSLHVQHGHGCSIAWHEPVRADGCDNRRIKATCLRRLPLNGVAYWDIVVDLDGEKLVDMVLCRDSRTYAVEIARATISAIKYKACHARRNRRNRKARRNAEREAVIAETVANPWLECYMTYVENDRNTSKNGWRQMMADFRSGKPMIRMIGTWRDVWARERGFEPMPQECPMDWVPRGATYENLQEILKHNI